MKGVIQPKAMKDDESQRDKDDDDAIVSNNNNSNNNSDENKHDDNNVNGDDAVNTLTDAEHSPPHQQNQQQEKQQHGQQQTVVSQVDEECNAVTNNNRTISDGQQQDLANVGSSSTLNRNKVVVLLNDDDKVLKTTTTTLAGKKRLRSEVDDDIVDDANGGINGLHENDETSALSSQQPKRSLSKFAARLFDPNRIKGLIEPPKIIPLNDEFLKEFGKREKETDILLGRTMDIQHKIDDNDDTNKDNDIHIAVDRDPDGEPDDAPDPFVVLSSSLIPIKQRTVKLTNLLYTTTAVAITNSCSMFGNVENVKLIQHKDDVTKSIGKAYVLFETIDAAKQCVEKISFINGRKILASIVSKGPANDSNNINNNNNSTANKTPGKSVSSSSTRYYSTMDEPKYATYQRLRELCMKCFKCGQMGHMQSDCPNGKQFKPCVLCGGTDDGHMIYKCPYNTFCFNCGYPGHVSSACMYPRGLPPRKICTYCYDIGHDKMTCPNHRKLLQQYKMYSDTVSPVIYTTPSIQDAVCMICGKQGHYMCQENQWNTRLLGVSCYNCGLQGHIGSNCPRPNIDICLRDEKVLLEQIEMASTLTFIDDQSSMLQHSNHNSMAAVGVSAATFNRDNTSNNNSKRNRNNSRDQDGRQDRRQNDMNDTSQDSNYDRGRDRRPKQLQQQQPRGRLREEVQNDDPRRRNRERMHGVKSMPPPPSRYDRSYNDSGGGRGDGCGGGPRQWIPPPPPPPPPPPSRGGRGRGRNSSSQYQNEREDRGYDNSNNNSNYQRNERTGRGGGRGNDGKNLDERNFNDNRSPPKKRQRRPDVESTSPPPQIQHKHGIMGPLSSGRDKSRDGGGGSQKRTSDDSGQNKKRRRR